MMTMDIRTAFPSNYLKTEDLSGHRIPVTIARCEMEAMPGGEEKAVIRFQGKDKGLVLNVTNTNSLITIFGTHETDLWLGKPIVLVPAQTEFQGKRVPCIRIDAPTVQTATVPTAQAPVAPVASTMELTEDDIPFAWVAPLLLSLGSLPWV